MDLDELPDNVKIKIWRYALTTDLGEKIFDSSFLDSISGLVAKLLEADIKFEEHLSKIRREYGIEINEEYVWTLPEPAILIISKDELRRIPEEILDKLLGDHAKIRHNDKIYKLVYEYPCG